MPNKKDYSGEVFAKCVTCPNRKVICRGIDTSDLPLETWRFFMRTIKEYEGMTYAEISEKTVPQIAARTIERKLAPGGDGQDLMRETRRAIENAILGAAQFRCVTEILSGLKDSSGLELELARLSAEYEAYKADARKKIDHLLVENERKNRIIDKLLEK